MLPLVTPFAPLARRQRLRPAGPLPPQHLHYQRGEGPQVLGSQKQQRRQCSGNHRHSLEPLGHDRTRTPSPPSPPGTWQTLPTLRQSRTEELRPRLSMPCSAAPPAPPPRRHEPAVKPAPQPQCPAIGRAHPLQLHHHAQLRGQRQVTHPSQAAACANPAPSQSLPYAAPPAPRWHPQNPPRHSPMQTPSARDAPTPSNPRRLRLQWPRSQQRFDAARSRQLAAVQTQAQMPARPRVQGRVPSAARACRSQHWRHRVASGLAGARSNLGEVHGRAGVPHGRRLVRHHARPSSRPRQTVRVRSAPTEPPPPAVTASTSSRTRDTHCPPHVAYPPDSTAARWTTRARGLAGSLATCQTRRRPGSGPLRCPGSWQAALHLAHLRRAPRPHSPTAPSPPRPPWLAAALLLLLPPPPPPRATAARAATAGHHPTPPTPPTPAHGARR
mmetsp:Transcript_20764/g.66695  ORF Transcript_20764/g.66695 Transcript_20764/m.66695 type:complete len:442 (+) Transcript_20764:1017-2342(+)